MFTGEYANQKSTPIVVAFMWSGNMSYNKWPFFKAPQFCCISCNIWSKRGVYLCGLGKNIYMKRLFSTQVLWNGLSIWTETKIPFSMTLKSSLLTLSICEMVPCFDAILITGQKGNGMTGLWFVLILVLKNLCIQIKNWVCGPVIIFQVKYCVSLFFLMMTPYMQLFTQQNQ